MRERCLFTARSLVASTTCRPAARSSASASSRASSTLPAASNDLRQLMRRVAQPVAVITCNLHDPHNVQKPDHGATVSSFVSISLAPSPLVAFALRLPSRLATLLNSDDKNVNKDIATIHIHLLSQKQEHLARAFARQPAKPQKATLSDPFPPPLFEPFPKDLFKDLEKASLGRLECAVIGSVALQDPLPPFGGQAEAGLNGDPGAKNPNQATSQLFIAKALSVKVNELEQDPLLYCHQSYYGLAQK